MSDDNTFRVWIGCLACYNGGRLTGEWYEASEAGDVTPEQIHDGKPTSHEELWCLDIENAPKGHRNEMSPMEAQRLADVMEAVGDNAEAFAAYCANVGTDFAEDAVTDFENHFCGRFDSFREYADECAAETLAQYEIDDEHFAYRHFDWAGYAHDLETEGYWTEDSEDGGVYVFSP